MSGLREFAEWLRAMDDPENAEGMDARRSVTLTQIIDRAGTALKADEAESRFTAALTDHERAMLMLALTFLLMDGSFGIISSKWSDEQMDRDLPILLSLCNELGTRWGEGIDPEMLEKVESMIAERKRTREQAATS